jgi:hypothetical protein
LFIGVGEAGFGSAVALYYSWVPLKFIYMWHPDERIHMYNGFLAYGTRKMKLRHVSLCSSVVVR